MSLQDNFGVYSMLWLISGVLLYLLYMIFHILAVVCSAKKLMQAILDICFFFLASLVVFLIDLVSEYGRLHFFQLAIQLIGFILAYLALDHLTGSVARRIHQCCHRFKQAFTKHIKKKNKKLKPHVSHKNRKKQQKKKTKRTKQRQNT